MSDAKLDELLRKWGEADASSDVGRDCPPLSVLWYHEAEGRDLGGQADHVAGCARCTWRRGLIRAELARATGIRVLGVPVRSPVRWGGGALALAASIALVFVLWPQAGTPSLEDQIAVFSRFAFDDDDDGAWRGSKSTAEPDADVMPEWVARVLADADVRSALIRLNGNEVVILLALHAGELTFDPGTGLTLSPDTDTSTARAERLLDVIEQDRQAIEQVVTMVLRDLPNASPDDRAAVRRAVDLRRAENVFETSFREDK